MKYFIPILAILLIFGLELFALYRGVDGVALSISIAAISGIAGFKIKDLIDIIKNKK